VNAILKSAPPFDVARARADFPILARQVYGRPLVYLDNAASAQKPQSVIDAMSRFMESGYANVHRGVHYLSGTATDAYEAARDAAQAYVNAARREEIVLTHGGTEAFNLVAESFLAPSLQPGDEIVLTEMEHHANIVPWHFLRERQGAVLKWARIGDDGALDLDHLASLIGPRTRLVAVTHMSNVLGTVTPAAEIVRLALPHIDWPANDTRWLWPLWQAFTCDGGIEAGLASFRLLLDRADPNSTDGGRTILHTIMARGEPEHLPFSTPLGWACRWGRDHFVQLLIARGADPIEPDAEPWATPKAWTQKRRDAGLQAGG
jgi:hypothetical protein